MSTYRLFKHHEREIARRLGGQRNGHTGGADVVSDWLSVECKTRRQLPTWLIDAMAQAARHGDETRLSVVVLHQEGGRYDDDILCMRLRDFQDWFGDGSGNLDGFLDDLLARRDLGDEEAGEWLKVLAPDR